MEEAATLEQQAGADRQSKEMGSTGEDAAARVSLSREEIAAALAR